MTPRSQDDRGVSLIELVVVVAILGVVSLVLGTLFSNMWRSQVAVAAQSQATTRGQLVASEVERAMRNAVAFDVSADGSTIRVNTALGGGLQCQAFQLAADGLHMTVSSSPAPSSGWPVWQADVAAGSGAFISQSGNSVAYNFDALSRSGAQAVAAPVHFQGTAYMRNSAAGSLSPCW
jgi:prepilin-type N-terminal cleavage/methylation domain-containing protein